MLNEMVKEYRGIQFIFVEEARELCEVYSKKNRKKNNQVEYMLDDAEKHLYRITMGPIKKTDWCGDVVINVTTKEEYEAAKKEFGGELA